MLEELARAFLKGISDGNGAPVDDEWLDKHCKAPELRDGMKGVLTHLRDNVAADVIQKGISTLDDCVDSDYDSNAHGDRFEYTTIRSDAAHTVFTAMLNHIIQETSNVD